MFSKKATKIDEIYTVDLTLCSKRQIDGEDFVNFHGLLKKYEISLQAVYRQGHRRASLTFELLSLLLSKMATNSSKWDMR